MRLLIVDDEPLVQAGIKSMINWEEYGINIAGTASNGAIAYELIQKYEPEIVISDIKMPVMSGLELASKCHDEGRDLPVFIFLTSYDDFSFVRQALTVQAADYLIKLELTPEILADSLKRAMDKVTGLQKNAAAPGEAAGSIYMLQEQFFTRLVLNLFESEHQFCLQAQNLDLDFSYDAFAVSYLEIVGDRLNTLDREKRLNLYISSLQMIRELTCKYLPCHVLSLDTKHFAILFFLNGENAAQAKEKIAATICQVSSMLHNYYSVSILAGVGAAVTQPLQIASSFQDAKQVFVHASPAKPLVFTEDIVPDRSMKNVFNMSLFKEDIRKAYAELDAKALYDIFTSIMELFAEKPSHYVQALDAAGNILYLSLSLLNNGEQIVSDIFKDRPNGYRSLYELTRVDQIMEWLTALRDGLCESFTTHNKDYKHHIVTNVKKYIREHIEEKLTLNKVAEVFSISPNYLSVLFSKYNDVGFNDCINQTKIEAAKEMMKSGNLKIYEISDILGFESAFYFSRVFKKLEGMSPRDYITQNFDH